MNYIIVQAGGKGTRLKHLTRNKPKALVPVENLPMLFYLFRKYPDKRFVIIADYHKEVLREYLAAFADVKYQVVEASGSGTCGGVKQAVSLIPDGEPFMLIWSDLILPEGFELPAGYADEAAHDGIASGAQRKVSSADDGGEAQLRDYIGISTTFPCRWSYRGGEFVEERSTEHGVAGFFLFRDRSVIKEVPESGELVRWMRDQGLRFGEVSLAGTREFGLLEEYEKLSQMKTRPFNRITIEGDVLTKEPVDSQGLSLAERESAWYEKAKSLSITGIPAIYETKPLKMEVIRGKNIYECDLPLEEKKRILKQLVDTLENLHRSDAVPADSFSMREAYYNKTVQRLSKIQDLVPFGRERTIRVNGRECRNVFYCKRELERALEKLTCDRFPFIHGDCTFSNLMLRDNGEPVFIDPRGYFGFTRLYGDARYDWAKLYYSIVGNYDRFNLKKFSLEICGHSVVDGEVLKNLTESGSGAGSDSDVRLTIESNGWEALGDDFFALTGTDPWEIKLLHAVIWLSLTTYAWQDYDSICGAFYNGIVKLNEVL